MTNRDLLDPVVAYNYKVIKSMRGDVLHGYPVRKSDLERDPELLKSFKEFKKREKELEVMEELEAKLNPSFKVIDKAHLAFVINLEFKLALDKGVVNSFYAYSKMIGVSKVELECLSRGWADEVDEETLTAIAGNNKKLMEQLYSYVEIID